MKSKLMVIVAILALALWVVPASALPVTISTPPGSNAGGGPVDASATFSLSGSNLNVTLTNLLANPTDVAQCISDLYFAVFNGANQVTAGTLASSSSTEINIVDNVGVPVAGTVDTGWELENNTSVGSFTGEYHLNVLGTLIGPAHLIIGPGPYTNANGSINNNDPHNPFLDQTATFTISDIPGLTADSIITDVVFSFGTTPGQNVVVPIPPSALLMGSGLLGLGLVGWRRKVRS